MCAKARHTILNGRETCRTCRDGAAEVASRRRAAHGVSPRPPGMEGGTVALAILGFATMIIVTVVLLKKWVSTLLAFTVIPLVAGFVALAVSGQNPFSIDGVGAIGDWIKTGIGMTQSITLMTLFSPPYFMLMADTGLFDDIVIAIMKRVKISAPVICVLTVVVACIVELDGSITSVFLITVSLMLPLYE